MARDNKHGHDRHLKSQKDFLSNYRNDMPKASFKDDKFFHKGESNHGGKYQLDKVQL